MSEVTTQNGSPKYWQSLEEWRNDDSFKAIVENEFLVSPLSAAENENKGEWARREFLKLMGASLALSSFGCVRRPAQKIVPYVQRPADIVEGIANYYSSSFNDGSEGFGVIVTTREGRPIKVDGNPSHPANQGGMSARAHAHILSLYDPNRLNGPVRNVLNETRSNRDTVSISYEAADKEIANGLKSGKWAILTSSIVSPSQRSLINEFIEAHGGRHYVWDSMGAEHYVGAQKLCFGQEVAPRLVIENARYILSVGADFLGSYLTPTESQKAFGKGRKADEKMNKLVVFESNLSLTGTNADERHRIRPSHMSDVLAAIAHELIVVQKRTKFAGGDGVASYLKAHAALAIEHGVSKEILTQVANELWENRGRVLVLAGEDLAAQVVANLLNVALESDGKTTDYANAVNTGFKGSTESLLELIKSIENGQTNTLIIHGINPAYAAAKSLNFMAALKKLKLAVYTGHQNDETGLFCDYVLPDHHQMEKWGDLESQKGVVSIQQPTIEPLGKTRAFEDTLISISKAAGSSRFASFDSWYDYLRAKWRSKLSGEFESAWVKLLQVGVHGDRNQSSEVPRAFNSNALNSLRKSQTPSSDFELVLYQSVGLRDGSLANVSWLQEFPDVVSKICWDNYASISPATAKKLNISEGQIIEIEANGEKLKVPTHVQPGQADQAIGLALGYGRTAGGDVANNVGVNANSLATLKNNYVHFSGIPAQVRPTKVLSKLANTGGHHSMMGRQIVVEATLEEYKNNPSANIHRHKIFTAWSGHKYTGHKWGMTIDLSSCTGCSACVIACQSENNIPTVGKERVIHGREMHWIRIDRYYVGEPNDPNTVYMPVLCQHCDNAPCETVCPVAATTHDPEGINDMTYNRCVGTRYCSNNCPYKVRRFNYFEYANFPSPLNLALNPEVTVRNRGVMEKCTFCTHKIKQAKNTAKNENRALKDGDVVAACQASCPTGAIVFGDVNDPESRVSKSLKDANNYSLLEELNAQPAVKYKSKIRNTAHLKRDAGGHHGHDSKKGGHA